MSLELPGQFLHSWDEGGREAFFILPESDTPFIHCWCLFTFPVYYCQWVGIWGWCTLYKLPPHVLCALDFIWVRGYLRIVRVTVNQFPHSWFPLVLDTPPWIGPLAWITYNIRTEEVPLPNAWQKSPPEAEGLCLFSNGLVSAPFPGQGSQLLGFPAFWFQITGPVIPALGQPGDNMLAWVEAEIFPHISLLTLAQRLDDDLWLCLLLLLLWWSWLIVIPHRAIWFLYVFLFLYRGEWYRHGLVFWLSHSVCHQSWSSCSSCGSSSCISGWVAAMAGGQQQPRCRPERLQSQLGVGGSCGACHSGFPPFWFRALNGVEQGSVGVGQTPVCCTDLCLSGIPGVAAHCFQISYQFVRILHLFRDEVPKTPGVPMPMHLPMLSHTPRHS